MSQLGSPRVKLPERARRGDIVEIRAAVAHPMESGFRLDNTGQPIPRHIVESFVCTYDGKEVFRAKLHPAVSSNPYFAFHLVATHSGDLAFIWTDDRGGVARHTARLEVVE